MKYYKRDNGEIYEKRETEIPTTENCEEISKEEYDTAIAEINERIQSEIENSTIETDISKDEYILELETKNAELEAENAALLYQILTGEELDNVSV